MLARASEVSLKILSEGHLYLKRYKVIAIIILSFVMWQTYEVTHWWMAMSDEVTEWQNAAIVGILMNYVAILKFCLEHILKDHQ